MQPQYPTHPSGIPGGALGSNPPLSPPTLAPTSPLPIAYGGSGASNSLPPGALRFFGTNASNVLAFYPLPPQRVVLGGLKGPSAVWYPSEWIGPGFSDTSEPDVTGFTGLGFYRFQRAGKVSGWGIEVAFPSGSNLDVHVYTGASPAALSFSGVVLTIGAGLYVSENLVDELVVSAGDCLALLNSDPVVGFTPSTLTATANFVPYP